MKATITFVLVLTSFHTFTACAETTGYLVLRAYVAPAIRTRITQTQINSKTSLVSFKSEVNTRHLRETQKFEVEGLDQSGLEAKLKALTGNDRTIEYELLVSHLRETMPVHKPIFLKISAN